MQKNLLFVTLNHNVTGLLIVGVLLLQLKHIFILTFNKVIIINEKHLY